MNMLTVTRFTKHFLRLGKPGPHSYDNFKKGIEKLKPPVSYWRRQHFVLVKTL
jgi:hypothetical protein